ncbi:hypothetical protein HYFRA_00002134 [Hymenoscyphus fraxineus]|uniref:Uncharacterized protein n=1 Tax=Hymenoscyphus fraxineus TaxID=746836 RepID=A0A9N9KLA1_9HELO|nr:hypothetical protein HYFRA_00002134 [Hymenoscyphus fraxineus]
MRRLFVQAVDPSESIQSPFKGSIQSLNTVFRHGGTIKFPFIIESKELYLNPSSTLLKLFFIAEHTMPEGFEGFSLTCKRIQEVAERFREKHNQLKRRYRNFQYNWPAQEYYNAFTNQFLEDGGAANLIYSPLHLIQRISEEPRIARYITSAKLAERGTHAVFEVRCRFIDRVRSTLTLLPLLQSSPYIKDASLDPLDFYEVLLSEYVTGSEAKLSIAFLLALLPNLINVQLDLGGRHLPHNHPSAEPRRKQLLDVVIDRANDPSYPTAALSKLNTLVATKNRATGTVHHLTTAEVEPYLTIKSLRRYVLTTKPDVPPSCDFNCTTWFPSNRLSNERTTEGLETFAVMGFDTTVPELRYMLGQFPRLKTLKFCYSMSGPGPAGGLETIEILSETLEELHFLDFNAENIGDDFVQSMHSFKKLKCLRLDFDSVFDRLKIIDHGLPKITQFLPHTLEKLVLVMNELFTDLHTLWSFLYEVHSGSEDGVRVLPKLENITILTEHTTETAQEGFERLSDIYKQSYNTLENCDRIQIIHTGLGRQELRLEAMENW